MAVLSSSKSACYGEQGVHESNFEQAWNDHRRIYFSEAPAPSLFPDWCTAINNASALQKQHQNTELHRQGPRGTPRRWLAERRPRPNPGQLTSPRDRRIATEPSRPGRTLHTGCVRVFSNTIRLLCARVKYGRSVWRLHLESSNVQRPGARLFFSSNRADSLS